MLAFVLAAQLLVASAASLPQSLQARAIVTTPPAGFVVTGTTVSGAGCPSGSSFVRTASIGLTVTYSQFYAEIGAGIPASDNSKSCQTAITASVPVGYAFGISQISGRGYQQLDTGVQSSRTVSYEFDPSNSVSATRSYVGPISGESFVASDALWVLTL
ncbi:hypothetical protein FA15DRAFT_701084 [Coprinopsis marcescibilis]|uniref:DUF4360 domain-containing protein n=1 Tax=Coprinopsis marcescibilis TaxID=230819 RepID=A0A5C3L8P3_COPMA|nr:hypothetical protein FA15DRAFT_701084 [Coprinopsis marcescibilis]